MPISAGDRLAMHDHEDAGVSATAVTAKADLLVTDNLKDFKTNDSETIKTRTVLAQGAERQLFSIIHERQDDTALVIAHPIDVVAWLRENREITPAMVRTLYGT